MSSLDNPWDKLDVTHSPETSGINLKPSDSGLSLDEEPLELGGSALDTIELPTEDEVDRQIAQVEAYFGPFLTKEQVGDDGEFDQRNTLGAMLHELDEEN